MDFNRSDFKFFFQYESLVLTTNKFLQKGNISIYTPSLEEMQAIGKIFLKANTVLYTDNKPVQGKKIERQGDILLARLQRKGIILLPIDFNLKLKDKNSNGDHFWLGFDMHEVDDDFVWFHGKYKSDSFSLGNAFPFGFLIKDWSLGKFASSSSESTLSIEVDFLDSVTWNSDEEDK